LVKVVERWLLAIGFPILVASAFFTPQLIISLTSVEESRSVESPEVAASEAGEVADAVQPAGRGEPVAVDGFTDLYGNEVTDAVATYTFDQSGSLYELHSPQTELPRLGIPKS
jgi:hypothetical protein